MKRILIACSFIAIGTLIGLSSCSIDDGVENPCEENLLYLASLKTEIEDYANSSVCGDEFECRYLPFGSKPCGGPWSYLVFSTSIDTLEMASMVEEYNDLEAQINVQCALFSDCSVPSPPVGFECVDNQCTAVY